MQAAGSNTILSDSHRQAVGKPITEGDPNCRHAPHRLRSGFAGRTNASAPTQNLAQIHLPRSDVRMQPVLSRPVLIERAEQPALLHIEC